MEGQGPGWLPPDDGGFNIGDYQLSESEEEDDQFSYLTEHGDSVTTSASSQSQSYSQDSDIFEDYFEYADLAQPVHSQEEFEPRVPMEEDTPIMDDEELSRLESGAEAPEWVLEYWKEEQAYNEYVDDMLYNELNPPPIDMAIDTRDWLISQGHPGARDIPTEDPHDVLLRETGHTYEYIRVDLQSDGIKLNLWREPVDEAGYHFERNRALRRFAHVQTQERAYGHTILWVVERRALPRFDLASTESHLRENPFPPDHVKYQYLRKEGATKTGQLAQMLGLKPMGGGSSYQKIAPKPSLQSLSQALLPLPKAVDDAHSVPAPTGFVSFPPGSLGGPSYELIELADHGSFTRTSVDSHTWHRRLSQARMYIRPHKVYKLKWLDHTVLAWSRHSGERFDALTDSYLQWNPLPKGHPKMQDPEEHSDAEEDEPDFPDVPTYSHDYHNYPSWYSYEAIGLGERFGSVATMGRDAYLTSRENNLRDGYPDTQYWDDVHGRIWTEMPFPGVSYPRETHPEQVDAFMRQYQHSHNSLRHLNGYIHGSAPDIDALETFRL